MLPCGSLIHLGFSCSVPGVWKLHDSPRIQWHGYDMLCEPDRHDSGSISVIYLFQNFFGAVLDLALKLPFDVSCLSGSKAHTPYIEAYPASAALCSMQV